MKIFKVSLTLKRYCRIFIIVCNVTLWPLLSEVTIECCYCGVTVASASLNMYIGLVQYRIIKCVYRIITCVL